MPKYEKWNIFSRTYILRFVITQGGFLAWKGDDHWSVKLATILTGFPLDLENLENLEKWEYTWKTWKYHGILKNLINIMEKWHETWKNFVATKNSPLTPLKQYTITEIERKVY